MKRILLLLLTLYSFYTTNAQSTIKGVISDEMGGVPNVNISIENSEKGTITNTEGVFEIAANKNDILLISHVAYKSEEVVLGSEKTINLILDDKVSLDEVVVVSRKSRKIYCGYDYDIIITTRLIEDKLNLKLYPNPSSNGIFNLSLGKDYNTVELQVASISGQIIQIKTFQNITKTLKIDLSQYPTGLYIINTIADGKRLPAKKAIVG